MRERNEFRLRGRFCECFKAYPRRVTFSRGISPCTMMALRALEDTRPVSAPWYNAVCLFARKEILALANMAALRLPKKPYRKPLS